MSRKLGFYAGICVAMAASWSLLSLKVTAQVTMEDADAFITDQAAPSGPAPPAFQQQQQQQQQQQLPPNPLPPSRNAPPAPRPPGMSSPRVSAQPVSNRRSMPTPQAGFQVRLAQAPKMLGDFFGRSFSSSTGGTFVGRAVHHTTSIDDLHRLDETGSVALYLGGPGGTVPGSFFDPPIQAPVPDVVEGLTSTVPGTFTAVGTEEMIDVFEFTDANSNGSIDPGETTLDLDDTRVFNVFKIDEFQLPAGGPGDLVGRARISDNNSALPQDRVYLDYSYFHNAQLIAGGVGVSRFAPGVEKTFADGMMSVEIRTPMAVTLNSNTVSGQPADTSNYEFGNALIATKLVLYSQDDWVIATGLGVSIPTGDDLRIRTTSGATLLKVENESVHLLPYLAWAYSSQERSDFAHAFLTFDFDTNGAATFGNEGAGAGLEQIGIWNDQNLVTLNLAYGSWLYENRCRRHRLQGIAWSAELHYTATLNDADVIDSGFFQLGNPNSDLSLLDATIGAHVQLGETTFTAGYVTPLTSSDRVFDGELRLFVNRAY